MNKLGLWGDFEKKIVCNELRRQGLMSMADWICDTSHCARNFDFITYRGYCLWANPCLRLMRKHALLARILAVLARWIVADIRYKGGLRPHPHLFGLLVHRGIFWPANRILGSLSEMVSAVSTRCSWPVQRNRSNAI